MFRVHEASWQAGNKRGSAAIAAAATLPATPPEPRYNCHGGCALHIICRASRAATCSNLTRGSARSQGMGIRLGFPSPHPCVCLGSPAKPRSFFSAGGVNGSGLRPGEKVGRCMPLTECGWPDMRCDAMAVPGDMKLSGWAPRGACTVSGDAASDGDGSAGRCAAPACVSVSWPLGPLGPVSQGWRCPLLGLMSPEWCSR